MRHPTHSRRFSAIFLAALPLLASVQEDPAVGELLEKLRSDRVEERDSAVKALIEKGRGIRPALLKAGESAGLDARLRIQSVIDTLDTQYKPVTVRDLSPWDRMRRADIMNLLAVTSDFGRGLFTKDGELNLRDLNTGKTEAKLKLRREDFIDLSGDGLHVLARTPGEEEPAALTIELKSGRTVETWEKTYAVEGALSPGGRLVILADRRAKVRGFRRGEGLLREWSLGAGTSSEGMDEGVPRALAVSWDDKSVAAVSRDRLWILDVASGEKRDVEVNRGTTAAFSPDGRFVLVGTVHGGLHLFDPKSLQPLASFTLQRNCARRVQFSSDGDSFLSMEDEVILWKR